MNLVSWNSAIQIRKRTLGERAREEHKLWYEIVSPTTYRDLVGNQEAVRRTEDWFRQALRNPDASSCLFVHGESGTGKSTTVSLLAKKYDFEAVTTYADQSRTPARLEGVVREAGVYGQRGVVVLDDFEIFLDETTSLRVLSKLLRQLVGVGGSGGGGGGGGDSINRSGRCLFIIISNSTHKLFGSLQDISTMVHFEQLEQKEVNKIFSRLTSMVRHHSYVPPMASYLSSISSSGTITQGVQQLQLLYAGNTAVSWAKTKTKTSHRSKRSKTCELAKVNRDCISYLWSDVYTDKILLHLVDDRFRKECVVDRLFGFERGRLGLVGDQLHDEYARRLTSMEQLSCVAEAISMSDTNRVEAHADALFDGENRNSWSASDICYISFVAYGVLSIKGKQRRDQHWSRKPHARLLKFATLVM